MADASFGDRLSFRRPMPDYRAINVKAEAVLSRWGVTQPPIPIKDIVEREGVDVKFVRFATMGRTVAGLTNFDEACIYVNAEDQLNRQTFTIAHEFGHWMLHRELFEQDPARYKVLLRTPTGGMLNADPLEKEANAFAAAILMPTSMVKKVRDLVGVREMARLFAVSPEAMEFRLKNVR
ncbi:ImmA/IrrE family metallo-endopeptidase [Phenylobacterium sp.]|uniref:ImmA/IrrE family metallo-endopeptidase n=1 Tax=Phenylobacterium sp. TaxID=1871053 RepID=UPI003D27DB29